MDMHRSQNPGGARPPDRERPCTGANLLRRTSDRIESWVSAVLLLVLVVGLPVASLSAGWAMYSSQMRIVHAQSAQRHQVTASLTKDASGGMRAARADDRHRAQVRWTEKDGTQRTGTALVAPGTDAGDSVHVWVDRHGAVTGAPMPPQSAVAVGWLTGGATAVGVATLAFAAKGGLHLFLDRRRYAQWDAEWGLVEPLWSARFRE
ncbi:Rv1733c family protein [Streptomyces chattanoogensis]|uniref:Rv1733c family protein n=1 Tax=Streptomyces chattanoogensis TaxID=66876 RepID=UPI0036B4FBD7